MRTLSSLCVSLTWLAAACAAPAAAPDGPIDEQPVREGLNTAFLEEDLRIDEWVARFELESREIAAQRSEIVAELALEAGEEVADIGAGTGLFLVPLSEAVGDEGTVYAVEISPGFVEHLSERAHTEGLVNIEVVLCTERECLLPKRAIDVALICDTYHHFTYPRTTLASLYHALRPGGRLFVIDFERIPGVSSEWLLGHVRAGEEQVIAEIEEAGFSFEGEREVGLVDNYMLRFER